MKRAVDTDQRPFVLIWEVTQACELTWDDEPRRAVRCLFAPEP